ncbi:hypothetical protein [Clostridium sp. DJ247]|uniref:hypothetical protein n=1 Tax=Clostridium sp. DJ247 TaxID=2726188 RepID=UPI001623F38B|nr:hypothetical protein [Clostridium sp. DJ247]MBC2582842.1 hypothetical protein [Clostridium sp. DJ247]
MILSYEKMLVAENCEEYKAKSYMLTSSMSLIAQSCFQCKNYVKGKCIKGLLEKIEEKIKTN